MKHPLPTVGTATPASLLRRFLLEVGSLEALQGLVSLLPEVAIYAVNQEHRLVLWSEGAERLLGFPKEAVLGQACRSVLHCVQCPQLCSLAEQPRAVDIPLNLQCRDGGVVPVLKQGVSFFDEDARFLGAVELLTRREHESSEPMLEVQAEILRFHGIISRDPGMLRAVETLKSVAQTDATVLIRGESGSGKELVARAIHAESRRKAGPFVAINCAALSPGLLESELFGHVKGAFTGAVAERAGIFAQAHKGTLFLDEVAELPLELQPKLLRVLQEREVVPVGGSKSLPVDVRVVAATHKALREEVKAGRFRQDLMYRLRVVPIFLPPLRNRLTDIPLLLEHFLTHYHLRGQRPLLSVSPEALQQLLSHPWPGNVRELQNVVEYAYAVARGSELGLAELPPEFQTVREAEVSRPVVGEEEALRLALAETGQDLAATAQRLGVSRTTLWRLRKKYGI